mmetsp:Transcript_26958/g.83860  ORF Transcript_26958/g.83860 Transcript_26958/m.83860 type:complete len:332 (+) Transcript_26958:144-1139(+)
MADRHVRAGGADRDAYRSRRRRTGQRDREARELAEVRHAADLLRRRGDAVNLYVELAPPEKARQRNCVAVDALLPREQRPARVAPPPPPRVADQRRIAENELLRRRDPQPQRARRGGAEEDDFSVRIARAAFLVGVVRREHVRRRHLQRPLVDEDVARVRRGVESTSSEGREYELVQARRVLLRQAGRVASPLVLQEPVAAFVARRHRRRRRPRRSQRRGARRRSRGDDGGRVAPGERRGREVVEPDAGMPSTRIAAVAEALARPAGVFEVFPSPQERRARSQHCRWKSELRREALQHGDAVFRFAALAVEKHEYRRVFVEAPSPADATIE